MIFTEYAGLAVLTLCLYLLRRQYHRFLKSELDFKTTSYDRPIAKRARALLQWDRLVRHEIKRHSEGESRYIRRIHAVHQERMK